MLRVGSVLAEMFLKNKIPGSCRVGCVNEVTINRHDSYSVLSYLLACLNITCDLSPVVCCDHPL